MRAIRRVGKARGEVRFLGKPKRNIGVGHPDAEVLVRAYRDLTLGLEDATAEETRLLLMASAGRIRAHLALGLFEGPEAEGPIKLHPVFPEMEELAELLGKRMVLFYGMSKKGSRLGEQIALLGMRGARTVVRAAREWRMNRRTLLRRCGEAGIAGPDRWLTAGEILVATFLVYRTECALVEAAGWIVRETFGFSNTVMKVTGYRLSVLAEDWKRTGLPDKTICSMADFLKGSPNTMALTEAEA